MAEQVHSFDVEGMKTVFTLRLRGVEQQQAKRVAGACLAEVERLEGLLSRYRPGSDISRINALQSGESLRIHELTYACLKQAVEAAGVTAGLFDVSLGGDIQDFKEHREDVGSAVSGQLSIAPDHPQVTCIQAGKQLDLGGIGKGFTLDHMAGFLADLDIEDALISAGASTHRALAGGSWPIALHAAAEFEWQLSDGALSASGTSIQGAHILHPDQRDEYDFECQRLWVGHPVAAFADAYSTACMLMRRAELDEFLASQPQISLLACMNDAGTIDVLKGEN